MSINRTDFPSLKTDYFKAISFCHSLMQDGEPIEKCVHLSATYYKVEKTAVSIIISNKRNVKRTKQILVNNNLGFCLKGNLPKKVNKYKKRTK